MNLCACLGKVIDVKPDEKHLKFTLSVWQKKKCFVPCVIFNPKDKDWDYITSLKTSTLMVWIQGWIVNHQIQIHGNTIKTIELATTLFNIKEV
ncbi:hypothetical protein ACFLZF_00175 [Nanoarchaeota archaeon]